MPVPVKIALYSHPLEPVAFEALSAALAERGHSLEIPSWAPDAGFRGPVNRFAADFELAESFMRRSCDAVIVGADDDNSLAAAISATKLGMPVLRLAAGDVAEPQACPPGSNARIVALLVPDVISVDALGRAASEIAAWAEAIPTLSGR